MTETATIRVTVETRDLLAREAADQGISVSKLLAEYATRTHIHRIYADERESWARALKDPAFSAEISEWDEMEQDEFD